MLIHAGDWTPTSRREVVRSYCASDNFEFFGGKESVPYSELVSLEEADEENTVEFHPTFGRALVSGLIGGIFFGGLGAFIGTILGSSRAAVKVKSVTFIAKFRDGRRLLATTTKEAFENAKNKARS